MYRRIAFALLAAAVALVGWWAFSSARVPDRTLGLFTSLPILWNEADNLKGMVDAPAGRHWALAVLERRGKVLPLDTLLDLSRVDELVIAQPRPLVPEENVALDAWVRQGGHVLMFADPMLTQESAFALGDRRRPQDVALVSPILARWGLELQFDESQPGGLRESAGEGLPINLAGAFRAIPGGHEARCTIADGGLIARCGIGKGRATLVADAALLEPEADGNTRAEQLEALLEEALAR
ncbi:ABC transporter [Novosphingobium jiangmenense]|uniref:ABC transporter n=1 Tax=Novosphingobium jiangmenense TaxID=2791981 RepID=A0ABS0HJM2_9SPHN|nr:ABC transporter [Novosphingobium jiangmenense]MBF9152438.1 ABC transporter [Novosphingobium jiangmenense]